MYRLRLEHPDSQVSEGHYRLVDCDPTTFALIASGQPQLADLTDQEIQDRGMAPGTWYFTAVWNPDAVCWVNDLTQEQAHAVYLTWSRPSYA